MSQLPLDLQFISTPGRNDFLVSDCNRLATSWIDRWPDCAGVSATATIVSHYPRRGAYRAHAAATDAFDTAHAYEHIMVKGARERPCTM